MIHYGTLIYTDSYGATQRFPLAVGSITIGYGRENDIIISGEGTARVHLRVLCLSDTCWAIDLGNAGGTLLNQEPLLPNVRSPLSNGDVLQVGSYAIRYTRPVAAQPAAKSMTLEPPGTVLPPSVAARLPQLNGYSSARALVPSVRRLRGNGSPRSQRELTASTVSSYMQYLPPCYHEDDFLGRFLLIFESILEPLDRCIDQLNLYFDPRVTPEAMLPWLASWVDLVLNEKWTVEQRRTLIRAAPTLYLWRGTRRGLTEYLHIYTGVIPTIIEPHQLSEEGQTTDVPPGVFYVILEVPDPARIDREIVEAIIEAEKPAHTAYMLDIRQLSVTHS